jgi:hypothetical protein
MGGTSFGKDQPNLHGVIQETADKELMLRIATFQVPTLDASCNYSNRQRKSFVPLRLTLSIVTSSWRRRVLGQGRGHGSDTLKIGHCSLFLGKIAWPAANAEARNYNSFRTVLRSEGHVDDGASKVTATVLNAVVLRSSLQTTKASLRRIQNNPNCSTI